MFERFDDVNQYVISLATREDRRSAFIKSAREANVYNYKFIEGFNMLDDYRGRLKKGQEGCKRSHAVLIEAAREKKVPYIIILEDDAVLDRDILFKFWLWSKEVPEDWDILYLGAHNHRPLVMTSDHVGKCIYSLSTVGYIVRNTVYDLLIEELKQDKILDMIYATVIQPKANCYCFKPNLITQASGYSDIVGKFVDYSKYYK